MNTTLLLLRDDLRLDDHPALTAAVARGGAVVPVFVLDPEAEPEGGAVRWWLHGSLERLDAQLRAAGSSLVLRRGPVLDVVRELVAETGADAVFWSRRHAPADLAADTVLKSALREDGLLARSFNAALLFEPWTVQTGQGGPYKVYTPYAKRCRRMEPPPRPEPAPRRIPAPDSGPASLPLDALELDPRHAWTAGLDADWTPGAVSAAAALDRFLAEAASGYAEERDHPGRAGTSRLSPHLRFGEIGPRRVWHATAGHEEFRAQLLWREFAHHLLHHFPHTAERALRPEFEDFPWDDAPAARRAWERGETGYPLVDAGMRQLWTTGWMHNRVRMVTASFLIKHLLTDWRAGEAWFRDTLVDADPANNVFGWQWTAGCGADASPFFRIFNPIAQGRRFDPQGAYVRRWVPELAALPDRWIHRPWEAPADALRAAGVRLDRDYPAPIVEHAAAREAALAAYRTIARR